MDPDNSNLPMSAADNSSPQTSQQLLPEEEEKEPSALELYNMGIVKRWSMQDESLGKRLLLTQTLWNLHYHIFMEYDNYWRGVLAQENAGIVAEGEEAPVEKQLKTE